MKKSLLSLALALVAFASTATAQTNLTDGKTVVPLGGVKTYTSSSEATYTVSETDLQKVTTEGNTDNVFLFPETGGGWNTDANKTIGIQGFYIDLGAEYAIGAINTTWEGAAASYKVYITNTVPAADGTLTGETEIANYSSNAQETVKNMATTSEAKGRYFVFVPQEATNWGWGVKIRTVVAFEKSESYLNSFSVQPIFFKANEPTAFTLTALDNFGADLTEDVTYTVNGSAFENPYTATAAGFVTITATDSKDNSLSANVYAIDDTKAPTAPKADDVFQAIYTADQAAEWAVAYNGGAVKYDEIALTNSKLMPFGAAKCVFFTNTSLWSDIYNVEINPTAKQYGTLRLDVFSPVAASGKVVLEGTKKIAADNAFTLTAGEWNTIEIDLDGETFIKAMSVRMDNGEDILLSNIYFTKAEENDEAGKISTLAVSPQIVAAGVATNLTLTASDAKGVEINEGVTYTGEGLVENTLTAAEGAVTITGSTNDGAQTATATVYALAAPTRTNGTDDIEILQSGKSATGQGTDWEGGYTAMDNLVYSDGTKAYHASNVTTVYLTNPSLSADDLNGFSKLHLNVFSTTDDNIKVILESIKAEATVAAKAGEWTSIDVPFEGGKAATGYIKIKAENKPELVIDNVYFSKEEAVVPFAMTISNNVATVTGPVSAENVAEINAADVMVIDMKGVTEIADDITIEPKNRNALVRVDGTHDGEYAVPTNVFDKLTAKNRVVIDTWVYPVEQLDFVDENGNKFYYGEGGFTNFISAKSAGYKITRSIPTGKFVTAAPIATVTAPEGVTVYQLDDTDSENITFKKVASRQMTAKTPYILHNTNDEAVDLIVTGTGDMNMGTDAQTKTAGSVNFVANLLPIETDGSQYILSDSTDGVTLKIGNGATVGYFRAYFTGVSAGAKLTFEGINDVPTGINELLNENEEGAWYTVSGVRVAQPKQGVYVRNGRKVVVR